MIIFSRHCLSLRLAGGLERFRGFLDMLANLLYCLAVVALAFAVEPFDQRGNAEKAPGDPGDHIRRIRRHCLDYEANSSWCQQDK